jgi:hypothetical protein
MDRDLGDLIVELKPHVSQLMQQCQALPEGAPLVQRTYMVQR